MTAQLAADDPKVRALAVSVLAKMDGKLSHADAAIAKALADPAEQVRAAAMSSVVVIAHRRGAAPAELIAALVKTLGSPSWADRRVAVLSLGQLGAAADVVALTKTAADPSSFVREAVAIALGEIGGAGVVETLTNLTRDDVPQVQDAATRSLAQVKGVRY